METNTKARLHSKQEEMMQISASSSPAHEFSFNISLQCSSSTPTHSQQQPPSSAIDLTPADDIFFHGHLLPLHLLHNIPIISPRISTNSIDGSGLLPIRDLHIADQEHHSKIDGCICNTCDYNTRAHSFNSYEYITRTTTTTTTDEFPPKVIRAKAKSFSLFGIARRPKTGEGQDQGADKLENKKKVRFDMSHFVKKYMKIFSKGRTEDIQFRKQPYSFSGKMSSREGRRDLRGEFSAPASMRTSPTNSGILSGRANPNSPPSNDSTMEELQAAIQAAIAHCKDSIAAAEKLKG